MSKLGEVMRMERLRKKVSQKQLGFACGIDRSCISDYENGKVPVPQDVLLAAVRHLASPRLRAQACFECQVNPMAMPYLDRVDTHPTAVQCKVSEELREALSALDKLNLVNKLDASSFSETDWKELEHAADQLADLYAGLNMLLGVWQERFSLDLDNVARNNYRKLLDRRYVSAQTLPSNYWRMSA